MSTKLPEIPLGKRNNYFFGMLLSAADFSDEQRYMRSKMRLHNRMLHGWGVVSGLEVSDRKDNADAVVVHAGVALDPDGNEIVILSDVECPIPEPCDLAYLVVYWSERETDFVPFPGADGEGETTVASRVEEYAAFKCEMDSKAAKQSGIALARLKKVRGKWKVDKKFRRQKARVR